MATIEEQVKELLDGYAGSNDIQNGSDLENDLGMDSLDCIEFIMDVEEHFEIEISDEDAVSLKTVQDVIDYVSKVTA